MMLRTLTLAFLLAGSAAALAATDDELKTQVVGKWADTAACGGSVLTFNADGTFISGGGTGNAADDRTGTFQIAGGKLTGKAGDTTMPEVGVAVDGDKLTFTSDAGSTDTLTKCQ